MQHLPSFKKFVIKMIWTFNLPTKKENSRINIRTCFFSDGKNSKFLVRDLFSIHGAIWKSMINRILMECVHKRWNIYIQKEPNQMVHYVKSYSCFNLFLLNVTSMLKKTWSFFIINFVKLYNRNRRYFQHLIFQIGRKVNLKAF